MDEFLSLLHIFDTFRCLSYNASLTQSVHSFHCLFIYPPGARLDWQAEACVLNLSARPSVRLLQKFGTLWQRTNESVSILYGTSGPLGNGLKRSTLTVRRSVLKFTCMRPKMDLEDWRRHRCRPPSVIGSSRFFSLYLILMSPMFSAGLEISPWHVRTIVARLCIFCFSTG